MMKPLTKDLRITANHISAALDNLNDAKSHFDTIDCSTDDYSAILAHGFDDELISKLLNITADIVGLILDKIEEAYTIQVTKKGY